MYVSRTAELKAISKSEDDTFSDKQLEKIIDMSPQKHKEAGFEYGWNSRFDTWYKMIKEFGFIKYAMGKLVILCTNFKDTKKYQILNKCNVCRAL